MILTGDCIEQMRTLPSESVQCCVTSPPYYGLRNYNVDGQIGLEATPQDYVERLLNVFREVHRLLRRDGVVFLNIGDSYARSDKKGGSGFGGKNQQYLGDNYSRACADVPDGLKPKDLIGIPWMLGLALRAEGWWLRSPIIWAKPNCMPGSQDDRPTSSYEHVLLLTKSERYFSDFDAIKTPPRESTLIRTAHDVQAQAGSHRANGGGKTNGPMKAVGMERSEQQSKPAMIRDVWFIAPATYDDAHFAVMPEELARRCVLAGSKIGDTVLDPFAGTGTTLQVALELGRNAIGIELNPAFVELTNKRLARVTPGLALEAAA